MTLLAVRKDPHGYAPVGSSLANGSQFIVTEDSIQVVDIRIVSLFLACQIHTLHNTVGQS
jgi:iron transport multicopper oxidase